MADMAMAAVTAGLKKVKNPPPVPHVNHNPVELNEINRSKMF
jgi:hypothetical protein